MILEFRNTLSTDSDIQEPSHPATNYVPIMSTGKFGFADGGNSCINQNVGDRSIAPFKSLKVAIDGGYPIVCALDCLDSKDCLAFGINTADKMCVLFREASATHSTHVDKCYIKIE